MSIFAAQLVTIARSQVGVAEIPRGSNAGAAILKYQQATDLRGQGWPWCAAFVDWVIQELLKQTSGKAFSATFHPPRTAGAFAFADVWAPTVHATILDPRGQVPSPGDIAVYRWSHIGIVAVVSKDGGMFSAVEGNTDPAGGREGWEVAIKPRTPRDVRQFVRLPFLDLAA